MQLNAAVRVGSLFTAVGQDVAVVSSQVCQGPPPPAEHYLYYHIKRTRYVLPGFQRCVLERGKAGRPPCRHRDAVLEAFNLMTRGSKPLACRGRHLHEHGNCPPEEHDMRRRGNDAGDHPPEGLLGGGCVNVTQANNIDFADWSKSCLSAIFLKITLSFSSQVLITIGQPTSGTLAQNRFLSSASSPSGDCFFFLFFVPSVRTTAILRPSRQQLIT